MMKKQYLHFCFQGEEIAYKVVLPAIRLYLNLLDIKDAGMIEVAISEAISNAVRASGEQMVNINMFINTSQRLTVRIRDRGKGFNVAKAMTKMEEWDHEIPKDSLYSESGRGLWVIHQVFDKVQYNRPGNELLLVKSLDEMM